MTADEAILEIHNLSGIAAASLIFVGMFFYSCLDILAGLIDLFCIWAKKKIDKGDKNDNV